MKKTVGILVLLFVVMITGQTKSNKSIGQNEIDASVSAANYWLQLNDHSKTMESYKLAGNFLRSKITQEKWRELMTSARQQVGETISRIITSTKYTDNIPGISNGDYVIIKYKTKCKNRNESIETITMSKENNEWKAIGYSMK